MEFHERLLMLRRKRGITQQEGADALGVSRPTYGGYESGKRRPQRRIGAQQLSGKLRAAQPLQPRAPFRRQELHKRFRFLRAQRALKPNRIQMDLQVCRPPISHSAAIIP